MAYLSEEFGSDSYWEALAARIQPRLGDLQSLFEERYWMSEFSSEYPIYVRSLCHEALNRTAPIAHWLLERIACKRWTLVSLEIIFDRFAFGFHFEQVVANLHEECFRAGFFPTSIKWEPKMAGFAFFEGPDLIAIISPLKLKINAFTDSHDRARINGYIQTLNGCKVGQRSALNMLSEWPSSLVLRSTSVESERRVVPPTLTAWVSLAVSLLRRAGQQSPTDEDARALTADIMGASSWDALESALELHASTGVYPLVLESKVLGEQGELEMYPSFAAGLSDFVALAARTVADHPGDWWFEGASYEGEFAFVFHLRTGGYSHKSTSVALRTLPIAEACDVSNAECSDISNLSRGAERLSELRRVFSIGSPVSTRLQKLDRLNGKTVLFQDDFGLRVVMLGPVPEGRWTEAGRITRGNLVFAFPDEETDDLYEAEFFGESAILSVERVDVAGNVLRDTARVSLDDGGLLYWAAENAWILTSGADFLRPVGLIRDLNEKAVRTIYSVLGSNRGSCATEWYTKLAFENSTFANALVELIQEEGFV